MKQLANSASTTNYEYRADGMRTHKSNVAGTVFTEYYHDGQMPMEDAAINGSALTVTRYGLGARGIDYEEAGTGTWTSSTSRSPGAFSNIGFPIYDAHGSMIASLARYGSNSFQLNNNRSYDAWGSVRVGSSTGDPKNRYCGSLGHQQDDESALVYMRARYYEPGSGRFVSEDSERQRLNWFTYCMNDPVNKVDQTGKSYGGYTQNFWCAIGMILLGAAISKMGLCVAINDLSFMAAWWFTGGGNGVDNCQTKDAAFVTGALMSGMSALLADLTLKPTDVSPASAVIGLMLEHAGFLAAFIALMDVNEESNSE